MTETDDFFEELRREYLTEAPARLGELHKDLAAARASEGDAMSSLRTRFHRLAGSGGSYGFPRISELARATERWLAERSSFDPGDFDHLERAIHGIAQAFDAAAAELGAPAEPVRRPPFGWRAAVVGAPGSAADRVARALSEAEYAVARLPPDAAPADVSVSERPDVAVLVPARPDEVESLVTRWLEPGGARPYRVILLARGGTVDELSSPHAGLDHVLAPDRVETELLELARTIARSATTPPAFVIVDPDASHSAALASALETAGGQVRTAATAAELRGILEHEAVDLIVTEWLVPGTTGPAALKLIRRTARHRVTPVVVHTARLSDDDLIAALESGADAVLFKATPRALAVRQLVARVARSRQLRSLSHRDELTGLLTYGALVEELDAAVRFATRAEETFALIVLDIDHFRRVNERWGYSAGDRVLAAAARAVSGAARASDFAARLGGEELGVIARRCAPGAALGVADKLRSAIAALVTPATGSSIRIKASAGVACYPAHGASGPALLRAAYGALALAKGAGRDRAALATS